VRAWLNTQAAETLYLSSVTFAELLYGIAALPAGKRKDALAPALDGLMRIFKDRILPFDADAARRYADLAITAKAVGRGFPKSDAYIAAIAGSRGFIVASRDTSPYEGVGLSVINPWQALS
jgi:predicted nucleic acid-binding protein